MSDDSSNESAVRDRQAADVQAGAAWRILVIVAVWMVGATLRPSDSPAIALPIDAWLGVAGMWVLWRADRWAKPEYLSPRSWTRGLVVPPMFGLALTLNDIFALVNPR